MTPRRMVPALVLVLAVPGGGALAQRARGGGGHPAGARGGGAVMRPSSAGMRQSAPRMGSAPAGGAYTPRGAYGGGYRGTPAPRGGHGGATVRPGHVPGGVRAGGVAPYRHPRAGTGTGSYYYRHYPGGGHGYYGARYPYYPYYPPYYGYGYYGSPYVYGSVYLGWPWYSTGPYYSGSYTYAPTYYYEDGTHPGSAGPVEVAAAPRARTTDRSTAIVVGGGQVRLEVRPDDASVYVDDEFRGTAREARALDLPPGRHAIELVRPGFAVERREVDVVEGERTDVLVELQRR